jgi:hypothetical protein
MPPSTVTTRRGLSTSTNLLFLAMIALTLTFTILNVVVVHQESSSIASSSIEQPSVRVIGGEESFRTASSGGLFTDLPSRRGLQETNAQHSSATRQARTFLGIFSRDDEMGAKQRQYYRTIFQDIRKDDPRICSLPHFRERIQSAATLQPDDCLLVYTFVVGAHSSNDKNVPAQIVEDSFGKPNEAKEKTILLVDQIVNPHSKDVNRPDVTRLNIR